MKNTIAIAILALLLSSCTMETNNLVTETTQADLIPCVQIMPITANQTQVIGDLAILKTNGGITIQVNSVDAVINALHLKFSTVPLSGNIAPGQFPFHIENPLFPLSLTYTWEELGLSGEPEQIFIYAHFDTQIGTAWAGDIRRTGKGQWYYYSMFDFCN